MFPNPPNQRVTPSPDSIAATPSVEYAGFWIRWVANFADEVIIASASWILTWGLQAVAELVRPVTPSELQFLNLGIYLFIAFPYSVAMHHHYGATWGKQLCGLRVVDAQTLGQISVRQASRRWWAMIPSSLLLMGGFIMAAFHPRKQGLHDLMAKTLVIRGRLSKG